jgi:large subunit ribosomal protein L11
MASAGPRQLLKKVKMRVPAGNATAAPPVGPTLGQAGVNLMDFCKLFNARTAKYKENIQLPVKLFTYSDRSFEFQVSTPVREPGLRLCLALSLSGSPACLGLLGLSPRSPHCPTAQPATYFLKAAAGIEKGTSTPGKEIVGQITLKQIYAIAQIKQKDPNLSVSAPPSAFPAPGVHLAGSRLCTHLTHR